MRSSVFTVPAQVTGGSSTVNSPAINVPAIGPSTFTAFAYSGSAPNSLRMQGLNPSGFTQNHVGSSVTSNIPNFPAGLTVTAVNGSNDITVNIGISTLSPQANSSTITVAARTIPNPIPVGSIVIPVANASAFTVGGILSGNQFQGQTTVIAVGASSITISKPTIRVLNDGDAISEVTTSGVIVYPVDQYVAPVEISIQPLSVGGGSVAVSGTVVPFDQLDRTDIWGTYNSDAGSGNLGAVGTVNTYSGKVVTAVRLTNTGGSPVQVALAEAGIIS